MTRHSISLSTSIFASLAVFYACGGDTTIAPSANQDAGGRTDAGADAGDTCTLHATARCKRLDDCTGGLYTREHFGDQATCVSREAALCALSLAATDTSATPSFYGACAAAIPAIACADLLGTTNVPAVCLPTPGARADGRACSFNAQCQSTWCDTTPGLACGTCAQRPTVGAACSNDGDCGGRGLLCAKSKVCGPPSPLGGPCDEGRPCGATLSCVGQSKSQAGTCAAAGQTVGTTCDAKRDTAPGCEQSLGLYCAFDGKCTAAKEVTGGAACGVLADGDAGAEDGGADGGTKGRAFSVAVCTGAASCEPASAGRGTCFSPAADGAACDRANGPPCLAPAKCVTSSDASSAGTCMMPGTSTCQ